MSLSTGKKLHDFIWTELPINDKFISKVKDLATKEKHPEMTKRYTIFEWIPGILITDKDDETQSEEYGISSTHEDEHYEDITENGEYEESTEKVTYEYEHPLDKEDDPSNDIIKNQDQNDHDDTSKKND